MAEKDSNTVEKKNEDPGFELGRRLDKIKAIAAVLSNQSWDTPLAGRALDDCGEIISDLVEEGREFLQEIQASESHAAPGSE